MPGSVTVCSNLASRVEPRPTAAATADRLLRELIDSDPILRLHLAVQVAGATTQPHPAHPEGTVALDAAELPRAAARLARRVPEPTGGRDAASGSFLVDYLLRPMVTVFRRLLDQHGRCLEFGTGMAFEFSSRYEPTGRLLVDPRAVQPADQPTVTTNAYRLDALATALVGALPAGALPDGVLRQIYTEELRHLTEQAAELLAGQHPLRRHRHSVAGAQDRLLRQVLDTVYEHARARRGDPALPVPVVMLDLDLCGLVPRERTLRAARQVSGACPGAPKGIPVLAEPARLPVLPTYAKPAWDTFLQVNALRQDYPDVDWDDVHARFCQAFFRPWEGLRADHLTPGVVRFVRDVEDAGGTVIFNTGRRDRVRSHTEHVLRQHGLSHVQLLTLPDDRVRSVAALKAENLLRQRDARVVAIFDDLTANRQSLAAAFPEALVVAVALPGYATDDRPGRSPADGAPRISSFETIPRPSRGPAPALSHAHSVAELHVGDLTSRPQALDHAVHLDRRQSLALVDQLTAQADRAADRTAEAARRRHSGADPAVLLHHVVTRKQFWRGSRALYTLEHAERDMRASIDRGEPVELMVLGFPIKHAQSALKAFGERPDLAELGTLIRLRELCRAAAGVYPPGLRVTVLTDGSHYRPRPASAVAAYLHTLNQYRTLAGLDGIVEFVDVDAAAADRLGRHVPERRPEVLAGFQDALHDAFAGIDFGADPLRASSRIPALDPTPRWHTAAREVGRPDPLALGALFRSLLHSMPVPSPAGTDQRAWSKAVYADPFAVADPGTPANVLAARRDLARRTWADTIRYAATWHADRALGYDGMFADRVRLTFHGASPGRCGFIPLGGSGLIPWQGTAAASVRGELSTDFAISLLDQGFVPVYSPLLGAGQPWLMVPITATRSTGAPHGAELEAQFASALKLRRR